MRGLRESFWGDRYGQARGVLEKFLNTESVPLSGRTGWWVAEVRTGGRARGRQAYGFSRRDKVEIGNSCAGINRHEVENVRVSRERGSDLLGPEFCAGHREVRGEA